MPELTLVIPSRNEMFLRETIADALAHSEADLEIIATLDGQWAEPPLVQNERVNIIYVPEAVGQRAATNLACKLSKAKYVAKVDAHCSFDQGWDRKMLEAFAEVGDDVTMVPIMRNLWAFDWKCYHCGWKHYQGPTPEKCGQCGKSDRLRRKMIWQGKHNPQSTSYTFDATPHFQYFEGYKHRPEYIRAKAETGLTESMSLQGSFFMCTRQKYWELALCDEALGNWGNQGIEVAMKTRLSGGRVLVNHRTWVAHLFRTQGGDFGFPYHIGGREVQRTKDAVRDLFWNSQWGKQVYPLSKVVEEFWPVPGWGDEDLAKLKTEEMKVDRPGIYSIRNKANGHVYIGSATSLARRLSEHLRALHRKDHDNKHLQRSWDKYGENQFTFNIERFCADCDLVRFEQQYIDTQRDKMGWDSMYNTRPSAESNRGRKHTSESLEKMSRQQSGEGNGFYGKTHTPESIEKMKEARAGATPWNKGVPCSDDVRDKISEARMGQPGWNKGLSKETDDRVKAYSQKLGGGHPWENREHPRGMLGKAHTEETKHQISESSKVVAKGRARNESGQFV